MTKERAIEILADAEKFFESIDAGELFSLDEEIEAFKMAIKALEQTRWIPVSKRLPKKDDDYLVTLEFAWGKEIEMGWLSDGEWLNANGHAVVAWMPLPEPWKGESE